METEVYKIIEQASDNVLARLIVDSYTEVERNFFVKHWKISELDAGHFVEAIRRFIELKLNGSYTPIENSLAPLNEKVMQSYINSIGDEAYRIHIPRVLLSVYGIRNKRGVGHISYINPNYLDATFIVASCKWVLAELVRINSLLTPISTAKLVDHIVNRDVEGIWEQDEITRILVDGLTLKEKIMFLLLSTGIDSETRLIQVIESNNLMYFRKILKKLHADRFIEYRHDGKCLISPKGRAFAEDLILSKVNA